MLFFAKSVARPETLERDSRRYRRHSIRLTDCHMSVQSTGDLYDSVPRSVQEFNQKLTDWILIYDTYN